MPGDIYDSVRKKVEAIFTELVGDRDLRLRGPLPAGIVHTAITSALSVDIQHEVADEVAFHIVDWNCDAGFIVALHLFPERFTPEEIEAAVDMFVVHVPAHVVAAARLAGHPTADIFREDDDDVA